MMWLNPLCIFSYDKDIKMVFKFKSHVKKFITNNDFDFNFCGKNSILFLIMSNNK